MNPKTPATRVREFEARQVKAGGRRMPGSMMSPQAVAALDQLIAAGYASSMTACIERALKEAASGLDAGG